MVASAVDGAHQGALVDRRQKQEVDLAEQIDRDDFIGGTGRFRVVGAGPARRDRRLHRLDAVRRRERRGDAGVGRQRLRPDRPDGLDLVRPRARRLREGERAARAGLEPAAEHDGRSAARTRSSSETGSVDNYHGGVSYHFGDSSSGARPYLYGGLGLTSYGSIGFTDVNGDAREIGGETNFSTTCGAGIKIYPERRRAEAGRELDADLHQVGRRGLLVRPLLGLLRRQRRAVLEPVPLLRRLELPLLGRGVRGVRRRTPRRSAAARSTAL